MLTRTITMKQIPILLSIGLYFSTYVVASFISLWIL